MYAIIQTSGKQYRVEEGTTIVVDRMKAEEGKNRYSRPSVVGGWRWRHVGTPTVKGAKVTAKVTSHGLADKKITFKYSRRQRTRRRVGYRAAMTTLEITKIKA